MFRNSNKAPLFAVALIGLLAFACIDKASAATGPSTVSWTPPTTYTDGSVLPAAALSGNKIGCLFTPTGGTAAPCTLSANTAAGSASSFTANLTYPAVGGTACFTVIATAGGVDSAPSNATCKTLAALVPNPPTNVTVTVTLTLNLTSASPISVAMAPPVVTRTP